MNWNWLARTRDKLIRTCSGL